MLRALWDLFKTTFEEWWNDNVFRLAAALAFYTIFSLAPVLLIATALSGLVFGQDAATEQIVVQIENLVGSEGGKAIRDVTQSTSLSGGGSLGLVVGIVTLAVGATVVFVELQAALNQIWDVKIDPNTPFWRELIRDRTRSLLLAVGVGFLLLVSLAISAAIAATRAYLEERVGGAGWLWRITSLTAGFIIIMLLFAMIYKLLPDVRIAWRDVWIGAMVTAVLFSLGKYAIGAYLGQVALGSTYGAAGSFAVLLIWIYYSALICFFGAEFTQVYTRRYGSHIQPQSHAMRIGDKSDEI